MKGLLLKDFYMIKKYFKSYFFIFAVFIAASLFSADNFFFAFYPCLLAGMIPVTLLGYDERSKWSTYCGALPYTKAQIVSGKYLIGLFVQLAVIAVSSVVQAVRMNIDGTFDLKSFLSLLAFFPLLSCFSSIVLPFIFRLGVEKGRIAYYIMIGAVCGGAFAAAGVFEYVGAVNFRGDVILPILCIAAVAFYALSWYLSVVFYKKREV